MKHTDPEFDDVLSASCDGRATDAQIDALEKLLKEDLKARDEYICYVDTHASLVEDCVDVSMDADGAEILPFTLADLEKSRARKPIWQQNAVAALGGLAAALVVGAAIWFFTPHSEPIVVESGELVLPPHYVAIVTHAEGALWEGEDASVMVGSAIQPGMVELCAGRIEFQLDSGVKVALEGPARLELVNDQRAMLYEGMLSANVPPEAIGFTVNTPSMEVVDLGTEFAVNANEWSSEVHVFDGEVEAILDRNVARPRKELLKTNHTRRFFKEGCGLEPLTYDPKNFTPPPSEIYGVRNAWGRVRALRAAPDMVEAGTYQHNYIMLFLEQRSVELEDPLEVSVSQPGRYNVGFDESHGNDFRKKLNVGVRVDSYMLHYDTKAKHSTRCRGTVRFDRPIVAVIAGGRQMVETDGLLGAWNTVYDGKKGSRRGLEDDEVVISADGKQITLNLAVTEAMDQVRVLVEAAPILIAEK